MIIRNYWSCGIAITASIIFWDIQNVEVYFLNLSILCSKKSQLSEEMDRESSVFRGSAYQ